MPTTFLPEPHLLDSPRRRPWTAQPPPAAPRSGPPGRADVVIVGAGPAGLATASALWHRGVRDVVLLDRHGPPCHRFFARIDVLRQRVLRSPYEHHPGAEGYRDCELADFARLHWALLTQVERREIRMSQAGHRSVVPVDVFEAYCRHVAVIHQVDQRTCRAQARQVCPGTEAVTVRTQDAELEAGYAVLCQGEERRPAPPGWTHRAVSYWDEPVPGDPERIVIIGAGLTAAHLVANALGAGRRVDWVFREAAERYQCSDINVTFFRPEGRSRFEGAAWDDRMALMRQQRRASIMFEFRPLLQRAQAEEQLTVHRGQPVAGVSGSGGPVVRLAGGGQVTGDHVVLALGTVPAIGAGLLPGDLIESRDGWPDLDTRSLAYARAPRVFAVGAAAAMALGPGARNIDGHRAAANRVAAAIAAGLGHG